MARSTQTKKRRRQSVARPATKKASVPNKAAIPASIWWKWIGGGLIIFAAALVVFWSTVHGKFFADDNFYIQNNPLLDDPDRLWKAWFVPGSFVEYYPIEQTLQWLMYLQFGQEPFGYHVVNIILHGLNAIAVWYFLAKLGLRFAWWGGLIYAVYPLSVESVGSVSEFKNTLSLIPFIVSVCFYLDFERTERTRDYLLSLTFFIVAMMCKISAMCFPLVLPLYAWYLRGRVTRQDLLRCVPFLVMAAILSGLSAYSSDIYGAAQHDVPPGTIPIGGVLSRTALIGLTMAYYLSHACLPVRPLLLYPMWPIDPPSPLQFLPWVLLIIGGWYLWTKRHAWGRPMILGVGAFFVLLLPALGFHNISYMCLTFVLDHLLYIPIIFLLALLVAGMDGIYRMAPAVAKPWLAVIPVIAIAGMALETFSFATTSRIWACSLPAT